MIFHIIILSFVKISILFQYKSIQFLQFLLMCSANLGPLLSTNTPTLGPGSLVPERKLFNSSLSEMLSKAKSMPHILENQNSSSNFHICVPTRCRPFIMSLLCELKHGYDKIRWSKLFSSSLQKLHCRSEFLALFQTWGKLIRPVTISIILLDFFCGIYNST